MSALRIIARCTTCKKTAELTPSQITEASEVGCAFSACCQAVATVDRFTVSRGTPRSRRESKQRTDDAKYLQAGWQLPEIL